eukprot:TRINITY_DN5189_c0_g1_i3.p1 TRINITY_DN5189_c0_g1~~TRINITY_DN5189_c0_g1_i3.p1  ORF type:complete len:225 (-),score=14.93 TRINITY_DN5189_c0_g1_i3:126-800(-)
MLRSVHRAANTWLRISGLLYRGRLSSQYHVRGQSNRVAWKTSVGYADTRRSFWPGGSPHSARSMSEAVAPSASDVVVVYVTVPDMEVGRSIAHALVEGKLAACCNIIPGLKSVYMWEGKVNEDAELLLMIKTRQETVQNLTRKVQELHPYDECEVIALPVVGGSDSYLKWVMDEVVDSTQFRVHGFSISVRREEKGLLMLKLRVEACTHGQNLVQHALVPLFCT